MISQKLYQLKIINFIITSNDRKINNYFHGHFHLFLIHTKKANTGKIKDKIKNKYSKKRIRFKFTKEKAILYLYHKKKLLIKMFMLVKAEIV